MSNSYDGEDILTADQQAEYDARMECLTDAHDETPEGGCEFWKELDTDSGGTLEYCGKHREQTHCCGTLSQCPYLNGIWKEPKMEKNMIVKSSIVMPAVTPDEAIKAFDAYQDMVTKIIRPEDIQNIQGKEFKKKSFWRKCQRFFNLSVEIIKEERHEYNGYFAYNFVARATAPNGAYNDGTGSCSSNEKGITKTEHNTRATAETRAKNRAIADLVGYGEVTAEEVNGDEHDINGSPKPVYNTSPATNLPPEEGICPKCGGSMWDNRVGKKNPKAPDFKCKDKSCDGVIWPKKKTGVNDHLTKNTPAKHKLPEVDLDTPPIDPEQAPF